MARSVSLGAMIKQLAGLLGADDLSDWERSFVRSVDGYSNNGRDTQALTERQAEKTEEIYRRHFA